MNDFLSAIRNMENAVIAKREAEEKAKQEAEAVQQKEILDTQTEASLACAELMGIEATAESLQGESKHIIHLGDWELKFKTTTSRFPSNRFSAVYQTSIFLKYIDAEGSHCGEKQAVKRRAYWSVTFEYQKAKYSEAERELIRTATNVGLNHIEHPLAHIRNDFSMNLHADSENTSDNAFAMPESLRLEMAGYLLDIEKKFSEALEKVPAWQENIVKEIARRKEEIAIEEKAQAERQAKWEAQQAEDERRWQEQMAKTEAIENERVQNARYTFSGETLGEILEQVTRAIVAQEQGEY